jgi:hypothetical protein
MEPNGPRYTLEDFQEGRVSCGYCSKPILDSAKAMEHHPTQSMYHEDPCFQKSLYQRLEQEGLDSSSLPPELEDVVRGLFGIKSPPKE